MSLLELFRSRSGAEFWADDVSYLDVAASVIRGHRQITDAYLVGLATAHDGVLTTLDEGLARTHPDGAFLLPEAG